MKKQFYIWIFICSVFLFSNGIEVKAQFKRIEIEHSITNANTGQENIYDIKISLKGRSDTVKFLLYKDSPLQENLLMESDELDQDTYTFQNVQAAKYSIIIFESKESGGLATIQIDEFKKSVQ